MKALDEEDRAIKRYGYSSVSTRESQWCRLSRKLKLLKMTSETLRALHSNRKKPTVMDREK